MNKLTRKNKQWLNYGDLILPKCKEPDSSGSHPYMYDQVKLGRAPSCDEAKRILSDLDNGRAFPAPLCEPDYRHRLEQIIQGQHLPDAFFQCSGMRRNSW